MDINLIEQEIQRLITEYKFEKDDVRKIKNLAYQRALKWAINPQQYTNPSDL